MSCKKWRKDCAMSGLILTSACREPVLSPIGGNSWVWSPCGQYISLKPLLRDFGSEGIENFDKVEKPILWFKGLRRRHVALFGFVLVVNLLNLPSIDAQNTGR